MELLDRTRMLWNKGLHPKDKSINLDYEKSIWFRQVEHLSRCNLHSRNALCASSVHWNLARELLARAIRVTMTEVTFQTKFLKKLLKTRKGWTNMTKVGYNQSTVSFILVGSMKVLHLATTNPRDTEFVSIRHIVKGFLKLMNLWKTTYL